MTHQAVKLAVSLAATAFWIGLALWACVLPSSGVGPIRMLQGGEGPDQTVQVSVTRLDAGAMSPVSSMLALSDSQGHRQWGGMTVRGAPETLQVRADVLAPDRVRLAGLQLKDLAEVSRRLDAPEWTVQWGDE